MYTLYREEGVHCTHCTGRKECTCTHCTGRKECTCTHCTGRKECTCTHCTGRKEYTVHTVQGGRSAHVHTVQGGRSAHVHTVQGGRNTLYTLYREEGVHITAHTYSIQDSPILNKGPTRPDAYAEYVHTHTPHRQRTGSVTLCDVSPLTFIFSRCSIPLATWRPILKTSTSFNKLGYVG